MSKPKYEFDRTSPDRRAYFKQIYAERRAAGLCARNGCSSQAVESTTLCWKHTERNRRNNNRRHQERMDQQVVVERHRQRLPQDREGRRLKFVIMYKHEETGEVRELKGYATTGEYPNGKLGEIFVRIGKAGHPETVIDEWAKAASLALQWGCGVEELFGKHVGTRCEPSGAVIGVDDIKSCTSILDLISRWVIATYAREAK